MPIAKFGLECSLEREQGATGGRLCQLCNWKTNRKSLSRLKTPFESLNQLFQNKCGEWLQSNFCYWDVVERGPGSELSSYWARQTAAWPRGGGTGWRVEGWGAHPFLPHTPHHPTPQCHFTSDLIHSPHPSFMFTLTSFPRCHPSFGRRCSIMADTTLFKMKFCINISFYSVLHFHFLFP